MSGGNSVKKPEEMEGFFSARVDGYDEHMKNNIPAFEELYDKISHPISYTEDPIKILDLGCGTGLELTRIFNKAPNALITGIDLSNEMLSKLKDKYYKYGSQIILIKDSYTTYPFGEKEYDYTVSVMTMHHWLKDEKISIYRKIWKALKDEGYYIEGDYIVSEKEELELLRSYNEKMALLDQKALYHIDIPMSERNQMKLLLEVGFSEVSIIHRVDGNRVFVAKKL